MNDLSLRLTETWFRLLADTAKGTRDAQETIRGLAELARNPEKLARRLASLLPASVPAPSAETAAQWMEGFWETAGVVPRARHLELLERYEALRTRLEEAEVTIQKLRRVLGEQGHERDAQKILDIWGSAVGETLKAQTDWMRKWIPRPPEPVRGERPAATFAAKPPVAPKRARRR